jgi:hypothetical protein
MQGFRRQFISLSHCKYAVRCLLNLRSQDAFLVRLGFAFQRIFQLCLGLLCWEEVIVNSDVVLRLDLTVELCALPF